MKVVLAAVVQERFEGQPCKDCGGYFAYVGYDLDHRDPTQKSYTIKQLRRWKDTPANRVTLWTELAKCDWICKVCHAVRTAKSRKAGLINDGRPKGSVNAVVKKAKGE
jgi:hypothetical protein